MNFFYLFFCLLITKLLSASPFIWATDATPGHNVVLVIDTATSKISQTISGSTGSFNFPMSVAITSDGLFAYVFNGGDSTVSVINTQTYQLETTIFLGLSSPFGTEGIIAISPNGQFAYITNTINDKVHVIDISNNSWVQNISISGPSGIAFSPDGAFAYVASINSTTQLFRIDTSTNTVTPLTIAGSPSPFSTPVYVIVTANGTMAYVSNFASSTISVINLTNNTLLTTISALNGEPQEIIFNSDETLAYVSTYNNSQILVIDTQTNTVKSSMTSVNADAPLGLALTPSENILYVGNAPGSGTGNISIFSTLTNTFIAAVPNTAGDYTSLALQPPGRPRQFARPSNRRP